MNAFNLERVNKIFSNKKYKKYLKKIKKLEENRKYCKHNIAHFIDTATIAYILNLEKGLNIPKDIIYAVGLLHDIGKWMQYKEKIPHDIASYELCGDILKDCDYSDEEIDKIKEAILHHRNDKIKNHNNLSGIFYLADKMSRQCFKCKAFDQCDWSDEKKNIYLKY